MKRSLVIGLIVFTLGLTAFTVVRKSDHDESEPIIVNKDYPIDFQLEDKEGNKVLLSDYEGKVVVLNFWASWCRPCKMEMPDLQKFHDANKEGDVAVVAVALDQGFRTSINFMDVNDFTIPYFKPVNKVPSVFSISAIPVTFIINKQGEIISTYTGATEFGADYFMSDIELARK